MYCYIIFSWSLLWLVSCLFDLFNYTVATELTQYMTTQTHTLLTYIIHNKYNHTVLFTFNRIYILYILYIIIFMNGTYNYSSLYEYV